MNENDEKPEPQVERIQLVDVDVTEAVKLLRKLAKRRRSDARLAEIADYLELAECRLKHAWRVVEIGDFCGVPSISIDALRVSLLLPKVVELDPFEPEKMLAAAKIIIPEMAGIKIARDA